MPLLKRNPASRGLYSAQTFISKNECENSRTSGAADDPLADLTLADITGGDETVEEVVAVLDVMFPDNVSNEVTDTAALVSNEVTATPAKPTSNKVTGKKRRRDSKDSQQLEKIRNFEMPAAPAVSLPLVAPPTPSLSTPPTDTLPAKPKRPKRTITAWDHTDDRMKLALAAIALQVWEDAVSWTFNLTPEAEKRFLGHPRGFVGSLSRAFNRAAKRRLGFVPHYLFSADVTKQGRLHLHGAMQIDAGLLPRLEAVMIEAWGEWKGRGKQHQIDWNPQRCDDGWPDYFLKARARVKDLIGDHTFVITKELRRRAKWVHGEIRETI